MDYERKCSILEGKFLNPCRKLYKCNSEDIESSLGLHFNTYLNSNGPSFSCMLLKSGDFKAHGVMFNFCPFCGTNISAPFTEEPK